MKRNYSRLLLLTLCCVIGVTIAAAYALACAYVYLLPTLPTPAAMRTFDLQVPLRVYTRSGQLMAQIGEQRRIPTSYDQIPDLVRKAFVAAEDDHFFQHHGFDWGGVLRSLAVDIAAGRSAQGASTITMQAARNVFLTQDRNLRRKLQEVFLTMRLEKEFSKEEILGLYLNVISFGKRSYGIAAAAETYFGKSLDQLTLAEIATLARVPQSPSTKNPIVAPEDAAARRMYVLRRMLELKYIDRATHDLAAHEVVRARVHSPLFEIEAPYVTEMVRLDIIKRFGAAAQNEGYKVYTTIDTRLQAAANRALRLGLIEYDRRHGWRGAQDKVNLKGSEDDELLNSLVDEYPPVGPLVPAIVLSVEAKSAHVHVKGKGAATIGWDGLAWARRKLTDEQAGPEPKSASEVLARGDIIYVVVANRVAAHRDAQLAQLPEAEGALVALDPADGGIAALVGGFDYFDKALGKFNRVTQAKRQPGSGFKPFLYSAALENGFTPSSVIMDAPILIDDPGMEEAWRPENSSREFSGPMRLREALVKSRNLVSIRILQSMGTKAAIAHATRFGFSRADMPGNLTLALGTMSATPLDVVTGYAVFANGGYKVEPYFIDRIEDPTGKVVYQAAPHIVCEPCDQSLMPHAQIAPRAISAQNAWLMNSMMAEVITRGTGRRALALGRSDLGGKTGTTNDAKDTWFNGFNRKLVATVWVGFDQQRSLGEREEGARTAVPIWVHFMREALKHVPEAARPMVDGLVQVRISPTTGKVASADDATAIIETFMADKLPTGGILGGDGTYLPSDAKYPDGTSGNPGNTTTTDPLF